MEDYLVGISIIEDKKTVVRIGEIAKLLGVKSSSAHVMVKMLANRKLLIYEKYGYVNLTETGKKMADQLRAKNNLINKFLVKYLGVDKKTAAIDSCGLEHYFSQETFVKLKKFISFLENRADHRNLDIPKEVGETMSPPPPQEIGK
jgi:DtxR family transcriptional regulator, Mn-dependent transcriptional regulator